jgi:hypothetical protein
MRPFYAKPKPPKGKIRPKFPKKEGRQKKLFCRPRRRKRNLVPEAAFLKRRLTMATDTYNLLIL